MTIKKPIKAKTDKEFMRDFMTAFLGNKLVVIGMMAIIMGVALLVSKWIKIALMIIGIGMIGYGVYSVIKGLKK